MRDAREPSVHPAQLFGRMMAANYTIPLKSIAIQNLYVHHDGDCSGILNLETIEDLTLINSTSGLGDDGSTAFMDGNYRKHVDMIPAALKSMRVDRVSGQLCEFLTKFTGLERLYLIGSQPQLRCGIDKARSRNPTPLPRSPESTDSSDSSTDINRVTKLKDEYIDAITRYHGKTLKHLLLLPQWRLTDDDIALIVRQCPNLEQLGIGAEFGNFANLRLLTPFLPNLTCLRLLGSPDDASFTNKMRELDEVGQHEEKIGEAAVNQERSKLKYIELGTPDLIFEIGKKITGEKGDKRSWRKKVMKRPVEVVEHLSIWKMDSLNM